MKTTLVRRLLTLAAITTLAFQASAQSLYWDSDGTGAGNDCGTGAGLGGSGNWDTTSLLWALDSNCAGGDQAFTSGSSVVFSGTAGTVNLTASTAVGNMTFNTSAYVISNNNVSANALTLSGGPTITVPAGTVSNAVQLAGTGGYSLAGPGTLYLKAPTSSTGNSITGPINVGSGSTLRMQSSYAIGGNAGDVTLNGGTLANDDTFQVIDGNGNFFPATDSTKNIICGAGGGTMLLSASAGSLLIWGNAANSRILGPGALTIAANGLMGIKMVATNQTFSQLIINGPAQFQTGAQRHG